MKTSLNIIHVTGFKFSIMLQFAYSSSCIIEPARTGSELTSYTSLKHLAF